MHRSDGSDLCAIHHTAKPGEFDRPGVTGARGAGAIGASVDGALSLLRKGERIQVRIAKQRAIRLTEFDYELVFDDDYAELKVVTGADPVAVALAAALSGGKEMSRAEMLPVVKKVLGPKATDTSVANAWWSAMRDLLSSGKAKKVRRGVYKGSC